MKRSDGPSLDTSNENAIGIILMLLDKVTWSLFGRDGYQWHALVGRLEPDDLWLLWLSVLLMTTGATIAVLTLGFLLFLCRLATRSQQPKSTTR